MSVPAQLRFPVLVTGVTGTLGEAVVPRLRRAGCALRVMSRQDHEPASGIEFVKAGLATGDGLAAAVEGAEVIVHLAGTAKGDEVKARNLVQAAARGGTRHVVFISVVGADRIPVLSGIDRAMFGYFASKRAAEREISDSGLAWTTLRATQFHEAILKIAEGMAKMPVVPVPAGFRFQPVAVTEVADRLLELALAQPVGLVPEMAGPRAYPMAELIRMYLRATHRRRPIIPVWLPGKAASAHRAGANLAPERAVGRRTWEEFLPDRFGPSGRLGPEAG